MESDHCFGSSLMAQVRSSPYHVDEQSLEKVGSSNRSRGLASVLRRRAAGYLFRYRSATRQLMTKHGDPELVLRLMRGDVWVGMSVEMLRESVGQPDAVERHARPTGIEEIWKFEPIDLLSYRLEVRIDDDCVREVTDLRKR